MAVHVAGQNPFGGLTVMSATGGMNMMIARPPTHFRGIDPATQLEGSGLVRPFDVERLGLGQVLRTAGVFDEIPALRQNELFSVGPIDLRMKGKVGRQALG